MGSFGNWIDYNQFISESWGWGIEVAGPGLSGLNGFSNIVVGTNPPYSIVDFLNFYPKYGGPPLNITGTTTNGNLIITGVILPTPSPVNCFPAAAVAVGQLVSGPGITPGSTIISIQTSPLQYTLSQPATADGTNVQISIYVAPLVPLFVISTYITLASASLVQARWQSTWMFAMALYAAHFCTLYLRSEGNSSTTAGAAAVAGLKQGITVASSAGGVSQTLDRTPGLDDWGSWNETSYGVQLAQFAKSIGMGPSLVW